MRKNVDKINLRVVDIIKRHLVNSVTIDWSRSVEEFYRVLQTEKVYPS